MSEYRTPEEDTIGGHAADDGEGDGPPPESGQKPESDDAEQPVEPSRQPD